MDFIDRDTAQQALTDAAKQMIGNRSGGKQG